MSYLNLPRVTFSGAFKASPSTVNNATINFLAYVNAEPFYDSSATPPNKLDAFSDRANFPQSIVEVWDSLAANGGTGVSWNPEGLALFSFDGVIRSTTFDPRHPVTAGDALIGATITTMVTGQRFPAKLVDLDPDQQMVTGFYGVGISVKLADGSGFSATTSDAAMASGKVPTLNDLWFARIPSQRGDSGASSNVQWVFDQITPTGNGSPLLQQFLAACPHGISFRMTLDAYDDGANNVPNQSFGGRIVGALGPALAGEPYSFVAGRRVVATQNSTYFPAVAQVKSGVLSIDLGNAIPLNSFASLQPVDEPAAMTVALSSGGVDTPLANGRNIDYSRTQYETFGGIHDIVLAGNEAQDSLGQPLAVLVGGNAVLREDPQGRFIMPEQWSLRLSPGGQVDVNFWTLAFGQPASLEVSLVAPAAVMIPPASGDVALDAANVPLNALTWESLSPTQAGVVPVRFTAAPSIARGSLPLVRQWVGSALFLLNSPQTDDANWQSWGQVLTQQEGMSFLLWCDGPPAATIQNPAFADIRNLMQGYAALYPAMTGMIDIGSQAVLDDPASAKKIHMVMSMPVISAGSMPVTRDMSPANRTMVLNYLQRIIGT